MLAELPPRGPAGLACWDGGQTAAQPSGQHQQMCFQCRHSAALAAACCLQLPPRPCRHQSPALGGRQPWGSVILSKLDICTDSLDVECSSLDCRRGRKCHHRGSACLQQGAFFHALHRASVVSVQPRHIKASGCQAVLQQQTLIVVACPAQCVLGSKGSRLKATCSRPAALVDAGYRTAWLPPSICGSSAERCSALACRRRQPPTEPLWSQCSK